MASFLVRAIERVSAETLTRRSNYFADDERDVHQGAINAAAGIGVTSGTAPERYEPGRSMVRNQFATFLARALDWLVTGGYASVPGTARVANDDQADAEVLAGATGSVAGTTVGATAEAGEPAHGPNGPHASVWYRFVAPTAGTLTLDTEGSTFDTLLAVYVGTTLSSLTPLGSTAGRRRVRPDARHRPRGWARAVGRDSGWGQREAQPMRLSRASPR